MLIGSAMAAAGMLVLIWVLQTPNGRGKWGESMVRMLLGNLPEGYQCLYDVLLLRPTGNTTEIDHVVVSPKGIDVIGTGGRGFTRGGRTATGGDDTQCRAPHKFSSAHRNTDIGPRGWRRELRTNTGA